MRHLSLPLLVFLLLVPALGVPVQARDRDDAEEARAALAAGKILPLARLMTEARARYAGRLIGVELKDKHEGWIYKFTFLPDSGRIFKVELDAASGAVRDTEGPVQEK